MMDRLKKIDWKALGKDTFSDVFGSILLAIGIVSFTKEAGFVPGGVTGIALILNKFFPFMPIGTLNFCINIPIIIFSWRFLGRKFLLRTFRSVVISSLFMDFFAPAVGYYNPNIPGNNPLLAVLFGGALTGAGLAIIYGVGSCTGGTDLITMCLKKVKPYISIGKISMMVDGAIIVTGGLVYQNVNSVLYGLVFSVAATILMDRILNGYVSGKMAMVVTDHPDSVSKAINQGLSRGSTILNGRGSYSGKEKNIILCAMSNYQLPTLKNLVKDEDPSALIIVLEYNEVYGTGFQPLVR